MGSPLFGLLAFDSSCDADHDGLYEPVEPARAVEPLGQPLLVDFLRTVPEVPEHVVHRNRQSAHEWHEDQLRIHGRPRARLALEDGVHDVARADLDRCRESQHDGPEPRLHVVLVVPDLGPHHSRRCVHHVQRGASVLPTESVRQQSQRGLGQRVLVGAEQRQPLHVATHVADREGWTMLLFPELDQPVGDHHLADQVEDQQPDRAECVFVRSSRTVVEHHDLGQPPVVPLQNRVQNRLDVTHCGVMNAVDVGHSRHCVEPHGHHSSGEVRRWFTVCLREARERCDPPSCFGEQLHQCATDSSRSPGHDDRTPCRFLFQCVPPQWGWRERTGHGQCL